MLFDKLSPTTDFISKLQLDIKVLNGNILYITHMQDKILKIVTQIKLGSKLQTQVDDYYDLKEDAPTSPQTDSDEQ